MTTYTALFYTYVDDILERRAPYREDHLALARAWEQDGRLIKIGVLGDPPHGALIIFEVDDPSTIDEFLAADPYVEADLVVEHRIEPWTVVDLG